ncbi:PDR/VanB family oxidoreductase [Nocardioides bruguierae]|uniref:PDR/VanB family oxidoreductase n=1 Tax=Nocardioides bruguierae TaxID=2945102 RepID=A0A9X2D7U1_9ACTN|nr:PDR/VanB family oxidoreductase [Nocardioides bruguierae]MCM0620765.1 PDR/VanB family oxidoreductase [Nocardioides bruguierae]
MSATLERYPAHLHPGYRTQARALRVAAVAPVAEDVVHVTLVDPAGVPLTPYEPGAHLVLTVGTDAAGEKQRNAYSLTGDGVVPRTYEISVLLQRPEDGGAGGSARVHALAVGDLVEVEGPRSSFAPRHDQRHTLLVAAGIGVTPVLSHARAVARWGGSAEILYSYRPGRGAHLEELRALAEQPGITLHEVVGREASAALLAERLADQPLGTHAYACGPPSFLEAYEAAAERACWPASRVHLERFAAPELDPGVLFSAVLADGTSLEVPPGTSLLEALLAAGRPVPNLCRQGVCGECVVPVRSGEVEHRDLVLSDAEREAGDVLLSCVSRAACEGGVIEVEV